MPAGIDPIEHAIPVTRPDIMGMGVDGRGFGSDRNAAAPRPD